MQRSTRGPRFYAGLAIVAAIVTIGLKMVAFGVTGSIGLFSDAAEGMVNLIASAVAFGMLTIAALPADDNHTYGHSKAEYLSSALEGVLILVAAAGIILTAWGRLASPRPIEAVGLGLAVSLLAMAVNGGVAFILLRAGRRLGSLALEADARHLLTDVWTSAGVVVGIVVVQLTGWLILDPIIAIAVALNIVWTGIRLLRSTTDGLLDIALPVADLDAIESVLTRYRSDGVAFHALRTRAAGQRRFVQVHVVVPGSWSVQRGHDLGDAIERDIAAVLPRSSVLTHVEPAEDPRSFEDIDLDRFVSIA